jgi:Dehydrogenases with different specificities (related to short-chain alcohol dehydrogenases)
MANPLDLGGRTILVTGASGGIGSATARLLADLGASVVLSGRDVAKLESVARSMSAGPHRIEPFDLSRIEAIPEWLKGLASATGPLRGIAHCAGLSSVMPIRVAKWESAERVMAINWGAAWALAKGYRQKGVFDLAGGRMVFIASTAGLVGESAMSAYSASKGAVVAMTRSLASEFAPDGINVNSVAPGFIRTEMNEAFLGSISAEQLSAIERRHPLGFGKPEDVANAVAFLLSDASRWMTGTIMAVDGGLTAV